MLQVVPARTGVPTARVDNRWIHSPYDPQREADRFVATALGDRRLGGRRRGGVIVVGAGLGYIAAAITDRYPGLTVCSVVLSDELAGYASRTDNPWWSPGSAISLPALLDRTFTDLDVVGLEAIEWHAGTAAFPDQANRATAAIHRWLTRRQASIVTTQAFGRLRLRNTVRNYLAIDHTYRLVPGSTPSRKAIVIAASGPSLDRSAPDIAAVRNQIVLWAPSSSTEALAERGLTPDLIIATDAGFYAGELAGAARRSGQVVAATLSSAPIARAGATVLVTEGEPAERALLETEPDTALAVPANGTVSGTALLLAESLGLGPVIFAGLDLCYDDLDSHARPHLSGQYGARAATRTYPALTDAFRRAQHTVTDGRLRRLRSLDTYAEWFADHCRGRADRFGMLLPRTDLPFRGATLETVRALPRTVSPPRLIPLARPPLPHRRETVGRLLDHYAALISRCDRADVDTDPLDDHELQQLSLSLDAQATVRARTAPDEMPREKLAVRLREQLDQLRRLTR